MALLIQEAMSLKIGKPQIVISNEELCSYSTAASFNVY